MLPAAEIPEGAHLLLKMQNSINTTTAEEGDYVYLQTTTPLVVDGAIVVPVGTYVQGVVSHVKRPGRVKGRGELGVRLETFTFPDGRVVRMSPRFDSIDGSDTGQKVKDDEGIVQSGSSTGRDVDRTAAITFSTARTGTFVGSLLDRSASGALRGAGIGAGAGVAIGSAVAMLTRGRDTALAQNTAIDIVFDRPVSLE